MSTMRSCARRTAVLLALAWSLLVPALAGTAEGGPPGAEGAAAAAPRLTITAGGRVLEARLEDTPAVRALLQRLPLDVSMENLYARELCHHLGAGALPDADTRSDGYEVGDIIYWPPMGSLVILYAQNGERFARVHLGHIDADLSFLGQAGALQVRWEVK